jgi:hypothetical protein
MAASLLSFLASLLVAPPSASTAICRGTGSEAESAIAATRVAYMVELVTATDSAGVWRRGILGLPKLPNTAVFLVTDETICTAAAQAYARHALSSPITPVPVFVVRVGPTRYYVYSPDVKGGEFSAQVILSETFSYRAGF